VTYPSKRPALSAGSRSAEKRNFPLTVGNQATICHKYGKVHAKECKANKPNCFKCGQFGHFKRNCPLDAPKGFRPLGNNFPPRRSAQAKVYTLIPVEVDEEEGGDNGFVTGTIFLFVSLRVLFLIQELHIHSFLKHTLNYVTLAHNL